MLFTEIEFLENLHKRENFLLVKELVLVIQLYKEFNALQKDTINDNESKVNKKQFYPTHYAYINLWEKFKHCEDGKDNQLKVKFYEAKTEDMAKLTKKNYDRYLQQKKENALCEIKLSYTFITNIAKNEV